MLQGDFGAVATILHKRSYKTAPRPYFSSQGFFIRLFSILPVCGGLLSRNRHATIELELGNQRWFFININNELKFSL
jgi:hypothetical protein